MRILVFGDSIGWGSDDKEFSGWVDRLKKHFKVAYEDVSVYNLCVSGHTTEDLLKYLEVDCNTRTRDSENDYMIIIAMGINDSRCDINGKVEISADKFKKNIIEIIKICRKFTKNIVFVGNTLVDESKTNPIPWRKEIYYKNENILNTFKLLKKSAKDEKIYYIDLDKIHLSEDGLHPSSEGHKIIFDKVKNYLEKNKLVP